MAHCADDSLAAHALLEFCACMLVHIESKIYATTWSSNSCTSQGRPCGSWFWKSSFRHFVVGCWQYKTHTDCTRLNFKFIWSHLTQSWVLCCTCNIMRKCKLCCVQPCKLLQVLWSIIEHLRKHRYSLHDMFCKKQCDWWYGMHMPAVRLAVGHWSLHVWRLKTVLLTWWYSRRMVMSV